MKIEVGESLFFSWLKHIKCCQIVQTNWKTSPRWYLHNEDKLVGLLEDCHDFFKSNFDIDILGKNASCSQFLQQAECDVIGLSCNNGRTEYYAVEVAFHTNGLQYGNGNAKGGTATKVIEKMVRSALCLYGYFNTKDAHLIFASPKINNAVFEVLNPLIPKVQEFFSKNGFHFDFQLLYNESFIDDVIEPLKEVWSESSDTSELFGRSMQLTDLFYDLSAKGRVCKATKIKSPKIIPNKSTEDLNMKIGRLAQSSFCQLIESGKVSSEELIKLQDKRYCKNTFNINFPCLVPEQDMIEELQVRYYKNPIVYNGISYKLCSQWFEYCRHYLEKWIESHS